MVLFGGDVTATDRSDHEAGEDTDIALGFCDLGTAIELHLGAAGAARSITIRRRRCSAKKRRKIAAVSQDKQRLMFKRSAAGVGCCRDSAAKSKTSV
jgi:hypothetical protein